MQRLSGDFKIRMAGVHRMSHSEREESVIDIYSDLGYITLHRPTLSL